MGLWEWAKNNQARHNQPKLIGQIEAMIREAAKDVRQTMNEVVFGKGEHAPELGTPGNPTSQNITQSLGNFHGYDPADAARAPFNPAEFARGHGHDQEKGLAR